MRSGIRFLAAFGILGVTLGLVSAQDRSSTYQPSTLTNERPSLRYFSRGERDGASAESADAGVPDKSAAPKVQVPDRYRRVQTDAPRSASTTSSASRSRTTSAQRNYYRELFGEEAALRADKSSASSVQQDSQVMQAGFDELAAEGTATNPRDLSRSNDRQVIHAEYEDTPTASRTGTIQQVRATEEAFPSLGAPTNSKANPFLNEETPSPDRMPVINQARVDAMRREYETLSARPTSPSPFEAADQAAKASRAPVLFDGSSARSQVASVPFIPSDETGERQPTVSVHWEKRGDISVGQESKCVLIVRNMGQSSAHHVAIDSYFPETVRLTSAVPTPTEAPDHLTWHFESLAPGEEQQIEIGLIPSQRGDISLTTNVRFSAAVRGTFAVQEPMLQVVVNGPDDVMIGDAAPQIVMVSNPGTGIAHDVKLEARIPEGLEHARGRRLLMEIGSLSPGESRPVRLSLVAVAGGRHLVEVQATAAPDLSQAVTAEVEVDAPSLQIAADGPNLRYLGRSAQYTVSVTNDGTTVANNVRVLHRLPEGFDFVAASKGGKFERSTQTVGWFVGKVEAGEKITLNLEVNPTKLGKFTHEIRAMSEQGAMAEAVVKTEVDGTASLVLEIVDRDDPVEVGAETLYEIRVRNNGSKAALNVGVACELPVGVIVLGAKGPADHISENGMLVFKGLGELAPGKAAVYQVHVKGEQSGNHRFRARLTSDSIQEPLLFEEITKFYQD